MASRRKSSALEAMEIKKIARDLGIDMQDLSLKPGVRDLAQVNTPARRNIKSSQLQVLVYPESDLDNSLNSDMTNRFLNSQHAMSPMSTPRHQTYNQFRKSKRLLNPTDRISKHYSSLLKQDQWDLNDNDDVLQKIFTEEARRSKRRNLALWAIVTGIIFMYISTLLSYFWRQWTT